MWKELEFVGLAGMLPWQGARVNTDVLVGQGQYGHSLHKGPSLRQCVTSLTLGGGSSFAPDSADPCLGPGPKQVCPPVA